MAVLALPSVLTWARSISTVKVSNDPQFAEKLRDVVGLYLNPPEQALVLSCGTTTLFAAVNVAAGKIIGATLVRAGA